jgi:cbb3-type cytochrome oxidase subunit 3
MTNDTKFLMWRGISIGLTLVEGSLLTKAATYGFGDKTSAHKATFWFILFFICCVANLFAFIQYRKAKADRWKEGKRDQNQMEVELLAEYAKQQHKEQEKTAAPGPENHTGAPK